MAGLHRRILVVLSVLVGVGCLLFCVYPQEPHLLAHSRRVGDTHDWYLQQLQHIHYRWLSGHEVLFLGDNPSKRGFTLVRRDLATGRDTRLTAATRIFEPAIGMNEFKELSPDGRRLLWDEVFKQRIGVVSLDGTQHSYYTHCGSDAQWMADSRHWIEWFEHRIVIHDVTDPRASRALVYPHGSLLIGQNDDARSAWIPSESHFRMLRQANLPEGSSAISEMWVVEGGFGANAVPSRRIRIPLPYTSDYPDTALSPRGDRIAYLLRYKQAPPLLVLLKRFWPALQVRSRSDEALWISNADGTDMHEIGFEEQTSKRVNAPALFSYLRWLPDGRSVSYIHEHGLYTVPVH